MDFAQSGAVVTGGASGLGEACVRRLVSAGMQVIILDRNRPATEALARELGALAIAAPGDICDPSDVGAAIERSGGRPLRLTVNCAFLSQPAPLIDTKGVAHDLDRFKSSIDVNITGTFNVMRLCAERMARSPADSDGQRGVVINTASIAAFEGQDNQFSYAVAKAAIVGMTLPAARDLASFGIRVMTIAPGTFATPVVNVLPEAYKQSLANAALFPARLGIPDDFARLVVHIFENQFLNAETIRLDAGARLAGPGWRAGPR